MFAAVLCLAIMGAGMTLAIISIAFPEIDVQDEWRVYAQGISVLGGAVIGYLVGRPKKEVT